MHGLCAIIIWLGCYRPGHEYTLTLPNNFELAMLDTLEIEILICGNPNSVVNSAKAMTGLNVSHTNISMCRDCSGSWERCAGDTGGCGTCRSTICVLANKTVHGFYELWQYLTFSKNQLTGVTYFQAKVYRNQKQPSPRFIYMTAGNDTLMHNNIFAMQNVNTTFICNKTCPAPPISEPQKECFMRYNDLNMLTEITKQRTKFISCDSIYNNDFYVTTKPVVMTMKFVDIVSQKDKDSPTKTPQQILHIKYAMIKYMRERHLERNWQAIEYNMSAAGTNMI